MNSYGFINIVPGDVVTGGVIRVNGALDGGMIYLEPDHAGTIEVSEMDYGWIWVDGDVNGGKVEADEMLGVSRIVVIGSLYDGVEGDEIQVNTTLGAQSAVVIDYVGWVSGHDWESGATIMGPEDTYGENTPDAHIWEVQPCRGDLNNDGVLNNFDVDPFVLALSDFAGYAYDFPGLEGSRVYHGDCNCSGTFTNADIDAFVDLLLAQCCTTDCSPCEGMRGGGPSAADVAMLLLQNTAPQRSEALVTAVSELAAQDDSRAEFWAEVLGYLGE